jgi:hypothetical protein
MSANLKFLLFSIIPLGIAICFYPIWKYAKEGMALVSIFTMIMNFIVTPVFLLILIGMFGLKHKVNMLLCISVGLLVNAMSTLVQYWNWGSSTGLLKSPDSSSVMMLQIQLFVSTTILIIGSIIITIVKLKTK